MIKVTDIAYAKFAAPDLDIMESFLIDFGLVRSARTETALYMRAAGPEHHVHITELGDPAFIGLGFHASSSEDLRTLSQAEGASEVEEMDGPGGGQVVRLVDPDGFDVDVIHGMSPLPPHSIANSFFLNAASRHDRKGEFLRLEKGPAQCIRLGHAVINVTDFKRSDTFYKSHFGFLNSDVCYDGEDKDNILVAFNRVDRGDDYVDHHTLLTAPGPDNKPGLGHIAFEVEDINAIHIGQEFLRAKNYDHSWGIGRHILGAQIFDYWFDPFGNRIEHWTDGDLLNANSPTGVHRYDQRFATQWGVTEDQRK